MNKVLQVHGASLCTLVLVSLLVWGLFGLEVAAKLFVSGVYGSCTVIIVIWACRLAFKRSTGSSPQRKETP